LKAKRRHDLKHDQLADAIGRLWENIVRHRLRVGLGVLAMALVAGIVTALVTASAMSRTEADNRLARLQSEAPFIEMLREQKPEEASQKAQAAIKACLDLAQEKPSTPAAAQALALAGRLLFSEGRYEEAAHACREAATRAAGFAALQRIASRNLAVTLEQAGKHAEAVALYRRLADTPSRLLAAQAWWDQGRCQEALHHRQEALQAYARAAEIARESHWAELALERARILTEAAQAPPPPIEGLTSGATNAKPFTPETGISAKAAQPGTAGAPAEKPQENIEGKPQ